MFLISVGYRWLESVSTNSNQLIDASDLSLHCYSAAEREGGVRERDHYNFLPALFNSLTPPSNFRSQVKTKTHQKKVSLGSVNNKVTLILHSLATNAVNT